MKQQKPLGQVAYEADIHWPTIPWKEAHPHIKAVYCHIAKAVARAVRRRGKGK